MAFVRLYPNDISADGTDVQQGFINDDNEIKRIYSLLDDIGAISLANTRRQSVLYASVNSSGDPNYITASGLNISIDGSSKEVLLAFAYGFDEKGAIDYIEKISTLISNAWTLPGNSTLYLYIDKDISTGIISYGYSTLEDVYQKIAPTTALDQHWFDTNEFKMKRWNGSSWETKQRLFVAKVVTLTSSTTLTLYPLSSKVVQNFTAEKAIDAINDEDGNAINTTYLKRSGDYVSVAANTTLTAAQSGKRIQAETAGITLTMPTVASGLHYTIYNNSSGSITLSTAALFNGTYGNSATTLSIPTKGTVSLFSDGTNWIVIFNNGALAKTEIFTGEIIPADTTEHSGAFTTTATIPLPSGYTREQCKYTAYLSSVREYYNGGSINKIFSIDQATGIVTAGRSNSDGDTRYQLFSISYTCIAIK